MIPQPFSPKTLLTLSSSSPFRSSVLITYFSTYSPTPQSNHSSFSRRHQEEELRNVRVSVWWDFENCHVPAGVNVFKVAQTITSAVRGNGIKGPIEITAFGDVLQLSRANQEALSSTGINLTHIPHGGKNSADRSLLVDLMYWVSQNPPPAHLFLISGDRDFAGILHRLRMKNYNILLASTETAPSVLCSAASIMWHWSALVKGENLTGRHFNQPPDGPYGSWYGHYRALLEDPFTAIEQPTCSQSEEFSESGTEPKVRPIPKVVTKQIRHLLSLYPKGISITELRSELAKSNVSIDKDFYGYKKFSRFLFSMPHILKLQPNGEGQFIVCSTTAKAPEPFEPNPSMSLDSVANNGNQNLTKSTKSNGEDRSPSGSVEGTSSLLSSTLSNPEEHGQKVQQSTLSKNGATIAEKAVKEDVKQLTNKMELPSVAGEVAVEVDNPQVSESHIPPVKKQDSASEVGMLKKIWRRWLGINDEKSYAFGDSSGRRSESSIEKCGTSGDHPENKEIDAKHLTSSNHDTDPVPPVLHSLPGVESTLENKTAVRSESDDEKSEKSSGLFSRIINWCKFWRNNPESSGRADELSEVPEPISSCSGKHKVFCDDSFWRDMESFIGSKRGSLIISQSKTRKQMAQNLQKEGPLILRSLDESYVLQLVNMLVSEKKWVEEYPSEATPFTLAWSVGNSTFFDDSHGSNGLSSIFVSRTSQSDLHGLPEQDGEKKFQNISHVGVCPPVTNKKPLQKSRREILGDCQKLVNGILKEFPEGYNIGSFRKLFFEKYGYQLNIEKLGYRKLASLLQIMPGVKIEANHIFAFGKAPKSSSQDTAIPDVPEINTRHALANSDCQLSNSLKRDDEYDSPWAELGPVDNTGSHIKELQSPSGRRAVEETYRNKHAQYESSLSDDDFSDSEGESSTVSRPKGQVKSGIDDKDSSLLQILDSWYSSKEGDNRNGKPENVGGMVDCSTIPNSSGLGTRTETSLRDHDREPRPKKRFSFVADPLEDEGKLFDGILGSLKKSSESRMHS